MGLAHLVTYLPGVILGLALAVPVFLAGLAYAHRNAVGFISLSMAGLAAVGLIAIALAPYLAIDETGWAMFARTAYPLIGLPMAGFVTAGIVDGLNHRING
jgi:hypothetical protein